MTGDKGKWLGSPFSFPLLCMMASAVMAEFMRKSQVRVFPNLMLVSYGEKGTHCVCRQIFVIEIRLFRVAMAPFCRASDTSHV
jgi:hypothetical protein